MHLPPVVSPADWQAAHEALLAKEKAATRQRDALAAERRRLPVVRIAKDYVFEGPGGQARLVDLFEGRRQLIVYHFMFAPGVDGWPDAGCDGCSMFVDQVVHLAHGVTRDDTESFGLSAFIRDGDEVYRSYFTSGRGVEALGGVWTLLDVTPLGRQETWEDSPPGWPQTPPYAWWRRHDEYEEEGR